MNPKKLATLFILILAIAACSGITPPPENGPEYVKVWICTETGDVSNPYCPERSQETFLKGEEPTDICAVHKELFDWEVCVDSDKLRHTWCPDDRIEIRKYPEGEEPTLYCDFHKEPTPQLDMELRVPEIRKKLGYPIYASAFFAKDIGINFDEFEYADALKFIDKVARENLSNTLRMFAWLAYPDVCRYPHPKKPNGKYDVNQINMEWYEWLHDTIAYCVERGIMVRLVIFDEHSFNRRWNWHWVNPDNNDGYRRADGQMYPMYPDKYGHTKWSNYCLRDGPCTPVEKEMYCTMYEYWMWLYGETIKKLNEEFGDYIAFESNEINAASFWHEDIGKLLSNEFGIPRWRMITSPVGGVDWINTKANIRKYWTVEVHGVREMADYAGVQAEIIVPWIWSWDGYGPRAFIDRWDELRPIVAKSYADGNCGVGGNNWLTNNDLDFANIDYKSGEIVIDELRKYLEAH